MQGNITVNSNIDFSRSNVTSSTARQSLNTAMTLGNRIISDLVNGKCSYSPLIYAIHKKNITAIKDILKYAKDNKFLKELLASKAMVQYVFGGITRALFTPLTYAIACKNNDEVVELILKYAKDDAMLKEVLNETSTVSFASTDEFHNALTFAISARNDQAILDILGYAEDSGLLKEILTSKMIATFKPGNVKELTPLAYAIGCKNDSAISDILKYVEKDNDILKVMLNNTANDLYEAIFDSNNDAIATFYCILNKPNVASQVFQSGRMRILCITDKKAQELAEKIHEGKYEEVIKTIKTRQVLAFGFLGTILMAAGVGAFAGVATAESITPALAVIATVGGSFAMLAGVTILCCTICYMFSEIKIPGHESGAEKGPVIVVIHEDKKGDPDTSMNNIDPKGKGTAQRRKEL
ncbi:hypothetical protein [Wolbachia endosymbiont (group E) of Neria commutata]|uniref:hypothetical protein n=1 Tax=Wolbachia endosymbiont (group E) of Neria commutata TaxID=3066149 RepID=UPI00313342B6